MTNHRGARRCTVPLNSERFTADERVKAVVFAVS
jgi:hypothetical protein